jgi:hypothetical protein
MRQYPGGARIRSAWCAGCPVTAGSGGGFEGDFAAECFELADVVALGAFGTDTGVVEAGAEVVEVGLWVGQQVPGDDQDGPADRDDGSFLAASTGDPPVAFAEEVVVFPAATAASPSTRAR